MFDFFDIVCSLTLLQKCQSAFSVLFTTRCLLEILYWGCWFWHLPSLYDRSRVKGSLIFYLSLCYLHLVSMQVEAWIGFQYWISNRWMQLIRSKFKGRQKITMLEKLVLRGAVWHIWKERNARVFQQRSTHKIAVFRTLYEDMHILLRTCTWKTRQNTHSVAVLSNWGISS